MIVIVMLSCTLSLARQTCCVPPPPQTSISTKHTPCYEDLCTCTTNTANCSRNFGHLTLIPVLPETVENVIFSFNNLTRIQHDDFFGNVSMIQSLDLQYNGLEFISRGAFRVFTRLRTLYLDHNRITYGALASVFVAKGLSRLNVAHQLLGPLPSGYFVGKSLPFLAELELSGNYLQHLNLSELQPLTGLVRLSAVYSRINQVTTVPLPRLMCLDLGFNDLSDLPPSCGTNGSSLLPRLKVLSFEQNRLRDFSLQTCLPKLEWLVLDRNYINTVKTGMFSGNRFPSLAKLSLQNMNIRKIEAFAFRNSALRTLSLMYCNMPLSDVAHPVSFAGIPNLKVLQASHNFVTDLSEPTFYQLFGSLKNLKKL